MPPFHPKRVPEEGFSYGSLLLEWANCIKERKFMKWPPAPLFCPVRATGGVWFHNIYCSILRKGEADQLHRLHLHSFGVAENVQ